MAKASRPTFTDLLFSVIVWAYLGFIFGALFVGFVRIFEQMSWPVVAEIPAVVLSGAVSALFYGSMQLTIFAAMAGTLGTFGYLAFSSEAVHPWEIFLITALAGLIVGGAYGRRVKSSRVFQADAKFFAGLCAGMVASAVLSILLLLFGRLPLWLTAAVACWATGFVYAFIVPGFVKQFHDLTPPVVDGALAGAGVAAFVGLMIWVFVGELNSQYTGPYGALAQNVMERIPQAVGGAALGGGLAGLAKALLGRDA